MENATWKDVVAEVMDSLRGAVELERIYAQVEQYRRAKTQSHWREKVRQTLQLHPALFHSPERGVWSHIKYK